MKAPPLFDIKGIEMTPLGAARKATDEAWQEISDALDVWHDEPGSKFHSPHDFELKPDPDTLGFQLFMDYFDSAPFDACEISIRLRSLLQRWGIATVNSVGQVCDSYTAGTEIKRRKTT